MILNVTKYEGRALRSASVEKHKSTCRTDWHLNWNLYLFLQLGVAS